MTTTSATHDDGHLVERARAGSHAAFADLVRRHQGAVRGFLARLVHEVDAADDLAQEAFVAAYENLAEHRVESTFLAWVLGIARHKALSYLRQRIRQRRREGTDLALAEARLSHGESRASDSFDSLPRLHKCLERLAPHSRRLVEEFYFRDQPAEAIAASEGKDAGAIRTALWRIRQALSKCLRRVTEGEST